MLRPAVAAATMLVAGGVRAARAGNDVRPGEDARDQRLSRAGQIVLGAMPLGDLFSNQRRCSGRIRPECSM
jgi:hypothetical protein